jgi:hypothetical protein
MSLGRRRGLFTLVERKKSPLLLGRTAVFQKMVYSAPKAPLSRKETASTLLVDELCKGKTTRSYILLDCKTAAKAFPTGLFLQRLQNE